MIIHPKTMEEKKMMANMPSGSDEQNAHLLMMLEKDEFPETACFMKIEAGKAVARAVLFDHHLGYFTVEDTSVEILCEFLEEIKKYGNKLVFHLYQSKKNRELIQHILSLSGFKCVQEKSSCSLFPSKIDSTYELQSVQWNDLRLLEIAQEAMEHSLDKGFQEDVRVDGKRASTIYMEQLKDKNNHHYLCLQYKEIIGVLTITALAPRIDAVNFIGVNNNQLGKNHGIGILEAAVSLSAENNSKELIADVDINNKGLLKQLTQLGFDCSSQEWVYQWER